MDYHQAQHQRTRHDNDAQNSANPLHCSVFGGIHKVPHYRKNASHTDKVTSAVRLGYVKTGSQSATLTRISSHRTAMVSSTANARQTSQAGKNDPRISNEGARVTVSTSWLRLESNRLRERPDPKGRRAHVFAPVCPPTWPAQAPFGKR